MNGRIRKTFGPLSSGTRCEVIGPPKSHGYVTIQVGPFSDKFYEQNHPLVKELKKTNGIFDIEADLVEVVSERA